MIESHSYALFLKFLDAYAPVGFKGIDPENPLVVELERMMENNDQFFHVGDVIQMKINYASKRCTEMMGIDPVALNPYHFFEATHPDDMQRHSLSRAKLFKMAHDFFIAEKGTGLLSTNLRIRNGEGVYTNLLLQLFIFFSTIPYKSVFLLKVHTNIDWYKNLKHGYHYYTGSNLSNFRFPDDELLKLGVPFSDSEFEIIRLIESGMTSKQIAEKIFLSVHTVNTHRRNILIKSRKENISELIYELMEQGVL